MTRPLTHAPARRRGLTALGVAVAAVLAVTATPAVGAPAGAGPGARPADEWTMAGHDYSATRFNPAERRISPANAPDLDVAWTAATGDVSATPAVVGGAVYFPDWDGFVRKLDARTGRTIWQRKLSDYPALADIASPVSRSSPTVVGTTLYLGTQRGARLLAIDTRTGALRWSTTMDAHPSAVLTQSPTVYRGVVYQGVSSLEEFDAADPTYPCCTFRASVVATDARTGQVRWRTPVIDDQGPGTDVFSGGAIWSGMPAIDPATNTVYVTNGNNYEIPAAAEECRAAGGTASECLPPWNRIDSFIALDLKTGRIKWSTGQDRFDSWNVGCIVGPPPNNCPAGPGPDSDFGDGAHLFWLRGADGTPRRAVGAGQKSGEYWMLDARTGEVIWSSIMGPSGIGGGIQWGTASDGRRIYFTESNTNGTEYELPDGTTLDHSSFGALDPQTGEVLWQRPEPHGGTSVGPVTIANGVMYAGSLNGWMYAFDAATGELLWEYLGEGSSNAGPAVVRGTVYWGNGYANLNGTASDTFYAFRSPNS